MLGGMSEIVPTTPSLQSIVSQNGQAEAASQPAPNAAAQPGDVSPFQNQQASTNSAPAGDGPAVPQTAVPPPAAAPAGPPQPTQQQSHPNVAKMFQDVGFSGLDGMDDRQVIEQISNQLDRANEIIDSQQTANSNTTENALPAQPAPEPATASDAGLKPKLSPEAEAMARQGMIRKGDKGWEPTHPGLQAFADELNQVEAYRQSMAVTLFDNPEEFANKYIKPSLGFDGQTSKLQEQIDELKQHLAHQNSVSEQDAVVNWVDTNANALWEDRGANKLTRYGETYDRLFGSIEARPQSQNLSTLQIHEQVLEAMQIAGITPAAAAPQQPTQASQSFMQQVAQTPPRMPENRLTEHQLASPSRQPNGAQVPTGRGGLPNLQSIIAAQTGQLG